MKKWISILYFYLLIIFPFINNVLSNAIGIPFIKNYSPKQYKANTQNWAIIQDDRGIMYFGNSTGVLEYDGVNWRKIKTNNDAVVRSLAKDSNGIIYVGTYNDFGYLKPDSLGILKYQSLKEKIPKDFEEFPDIWNIHVIKNKIYFKSYKYLFVLNNDKIKVIEPTLSEFNESFVYRDELYIEYWQVGLGKLVGDSVKLILNSDQFSGDYPGVSAILPYDTLSIIGNPNSGLFLFDGKSVKKFENEVDDYLINNQFYQGVMLDEEHYAFTTVNGGVVIMTKNGKLKKVLSKKSGLANNTIWFIYIDNQKSIWLATDNGISHIEYPPPITKYEIYDDEFGRINQILRHKNKLYIAANNGVFYLNEDRGNQGNFELKRAGGINEIAWSLLPFGEDLLIGANNGTYILKNQNIRQIRKDNSVYLYKSNQFKNRIYIGLIDGLASMHYEDGKWIDDGKIEGIEEYINNKIIETENGDLWLGHYQGIIRIKFNGTFSNSPEVEKYDTENGLPANKNNYVFSNQNKTLFATPKGIYRFDEKGNRFIPDSTFGIAFANGERSVFNIAPDEEGRIWMYSNDQIGYLTYNNEAKYNWVEKPFLRLHKFNTNIIYPDKNGITWFGGSDGLFRYDQSVKKNYNFSQSAIIRKVITFNDSVLYGGFSWTKKSIVSEYPYQYNSINFEYSLPGYDAEESNSYQYHLEGFDKNWSQWVTEPKSNYTNIPEGRYVFRVRAKNIYNVIGEEAQYAFIILPPWYRSWWAYLIYGLIIVGTVLGLIKLRSYKLESEKRQLEKIIHERTDEIQEKNIQLEKQAEKLKEMDEIKSRFFANISHELRTPLTLIKGPAEGILDDTYPGEKEKALKLILMNTNRMLKLINEMLDLSKLESGNMKLNTTLQDLTKFVSMVVNSFTSLAQQNMINLQFIKPAEEIKLYFDREKLEKVLYNILSNAFKFTPQNGFITVALSQIKTELYPLGAAEISVHDSGFGIPKKEIAQIFDRFIQADNINNSHAEGSGIGLALAKELVELHHGKIRVTSSKDEGTEFDLILPMGKDHLQPQEIIDSDKISQQKESKLLPDISEIQSREAKKQPQEKIVISDAKHIILIVEDNTEVRQYIKEHFEKKYEVIEAGDGTVALNLAQEYLPDIIISDVMMPKMDGLDLSQKLKHSELTNHIPIILLTAKASDEDKIEGLELGVEAYMAKPFNVKELEIRIKKLIENRIKLREKFKKEFLLEPSKPDVVSMDDEFIKKVHDKIEQKMADPDFNVETLLKDFAFGQRQFTRKVIALTGQTPVLFIRIMRLKKAKQLIQQKGGTVSQVAFDVGFSNLSYFSKCFRQQFGKLPSEI